MLKHHFFRAAIKVALSAVYLLSATQANASCESVYENATRNVTFTESNYSAMFVLYDNICEMNGEIRNNIADVQLEAVIKKIPVKFKANKNDKREVVKSYCREYNEVRQSKSLERVSKSEVVTEALTNFNSCMMIQKKYNVEIGHRFITPGAIIFDVVFGGQGQVLSLSDVPHSDNFECTSSNIGKDGQPLILGSKQPNIEARSNFNIVCRRDEIKETDGSVRYAPGFVGLATTWGSYSVSLPSDEIYSSELASEARQQINTLVASTKSLSDSLNTANEEKSKLQKSIDNLNKKIRDTRIEHKVVTLGGGGPGINYGCGVSLDSARALTCPQATSMTPAEQTGIRRGGPCGTATYVFACLFQ
jgi:hypothetical protein